MHTFRRKLLLTLLKLSDTCILTVSLLLAAWYTAPGASWPSLAEFLAVRIGLINAVAMLGAVVLWYLLFRHFGLYRSRRLSRAIREWADILKATSIGTALLAMGWTVMKVSFLTPRFVTAAWLTATVLTLAFRTALRFGLKKVHLSGRNLRNILIVGTNLRAYQFARMIEEEKELGYQLLGFLDDRIHAPRPGVALLGGVKDFPAILGDQIVDEVFIALPVKSYYDQTRSIVEKAEEHGVIVRYLSELFDPKIGQSRVEAFEHLQMLTIATGPPDGWEYFAKHCVDKILAIMLLLVTSPLLLLAAVATKLTSPGPVFFVQPRVGRNKRVFRLYKFRTMVASAEELQKEVEALNEMDGPVFKARNDPRITRVGRWLRKWSIDELPQLLNVVWGDMSLVGPRPLPLRDFEGFGDSWRRRRFSVRPGITCTWQIMGRNDRSFEEWMKLDMEYIDNWTLGNDMRILIRTIPAVLRGGGV